jgi:2-polyprenyl-6-methoxyphenol hydroxylase-like FAD-dependent oxidoreductase
MRNPIFKQAVVVGAGMAGLAAAKAIESHFEKVTVFDRDSPARRPGAAFGDATGAPYARAAPGRTFRARPDVPWDRD